MWWDIFSVIMDYIIIPIFSVISIVCLIYLGVTFYNEVIKGRTPEDGERIWE